jgi:hypothetical protein
MKKLFFLLLLFYQGYSQSYTIKGSLVDTSNAPLEFATIFLLNPSDSTMLTFGRTDAAGQFEFKGVKKGDVVLQATFIGFLPYKETIPFDPNKLTVDLGALKLKPIDKELYEVVIKTAKAPMSFKGDTVEYDASKFKVPPGSTVEDLLRRLPGFQVDSDGNIKAQGENITKVMVGGKRFFGSDPKAATKNLPSEAISKVQVYNDTSEQSKLTGVADGQTEKTLNLELKDEYKKGAFGKLTAGVGTEDRLMAKGNYNRFDDKNQFSIIGFGNNINQSGLSSNDYQDFKGSQSYNWGDNVDFGFSTGDMIIFMDGGSGEDLGVPQSWGPDRGQSKNFAGGINYNYDTKKDKISSNYFYNKSEQQLKQERFRNIFLPNTQYNVSSQEFYKNAIGNHRMSVRYERELDSLRTLIAYANGRLADRDNISDVKQQYFNLQNERFRDQNPYSTSLGTTSALESSVLFRNKFKKVGRSFLWSGTYKLDYNDNEALQQSAFQQYVVGGENFPILDSNSVRLNQLSLGLTKSTILKSSLLYNEPISKTVTWDIFANISKNWQSTDRNIYSPPLQNIANRNEDLSVFFDNELDLQRVGSSIKYTNKGTFAMFGLAAQNLSLNGEVLTAEGGKLHTRIGKNFFKLLPTASFRYSISNNSRFHLGANVKQSAPTLAQLMPFIDNSNPMFISTGNPDLKPSTTREITANYSYFNDISFFSLFAFGSYRNYRDRIVYNREVREDLVTYSSTSNIKNGGDNYNFHLGINFPIKKTKLMADLSLYGNAGKSPLYINEVLNTNQFTSVGISTGLNFTPAPWMAWFVGYNTSHSKTNYSIFKQQNQKYYAQSFNSDLSFQLPNKYFITSLFNYTFQKNERINLEQHLPILGFSAYKIFGKKNQHEIRLTAHDVFNRNLGVSQSASANEVSYTNTSMLSRYYMLSYSFNIRGMKTQIKRNRWED